MLKSPRKLLLDQFHDWDLTSPLNPGELAIVRDSSLTILMLFSEQCGFWDGLNSYTFQVSGLDEGSIVFTYVLLFIFIVF